MTGSAIRRGVHAVSGARIASPGEAGGIVRAGGARRGSRGGGARPGDEPGDQQLVAGAPRGGRRRPGEPGQLLLGVKQRRLGPLQADVRRHELPHLLPDRLAVARRHRCRAGAARSVGRGRGVARGGAAARPPARGPRGRRRPAPRAASSTPAGWRRARRSRPPRRPPRAPARWRGPRDRCERRPSRSAAPARPGAGRAQDRGRGCASMAVMPGNSAGEVLDCRGHRARRRRRHPPRRPLGRRCPEEPARPGDRRRARTGARPGPPACAPAPRTASEMSGAGLTPGSLSAVGWNWRNSMSRSCRAGPVRQRPAVRGGHLRIGGDRVQLADAAGGQHDGARPG